MAGQIQLTFLLAIIACMVHSAPLTEQNTEPFIEIRANIDKVVDALLPSIHDFILKHGMDPMHLTDISTNIFPDLPEKLKGNVELNGGWLQNLSLLKRTEHVTAIYEDMRLTLDMNLGFDIVNLNYEYYLKYLLYKRSGAIYGRADQLNVNVVMTVDLKEYHLILDSIKFTDVRKLDAKLEGHLSDRLLNGVIKVITTLFKNEILKVAENFATNGFSAKVNEWNTLISKSNRTKIIDGWLDIAKFPN